MADWHLDKRVNISHIFATASVAFAAMWWGAQMDRRVSVLETQMVAADERRGNMERHITSRLDRIEEKLDRVIEAR